MIIIVLVRSEQKKPERCICVFEAMLHGCGVNKGVGKLDKERKRNKNNVHGFDMMQVRNEQDRWGGAGGSGEHGEEGTAKEERRRK